MLVVLWNMRTTRRDLFVPAVVLFAGIPAQAVVGGITVLTQLNPWVVGWHFIISMVLITVATVLVNRTRRSPAEAEADNTPRATPLLRQLLAAAGVLVTAAVLLGVVVTGSGPHAGDAGAARNNLNPDLMTRIHAAPVYLLVLTVLVLVFAAYRLRVAQRLRFALVLLTVVVFAQGAVGYLQHFLHLPVALVALHMLGASVLTAAMAHAIYIGYSRRRVEAATGAD